MSSVLRKHRELYGSTKRRPKKRRNVRSVRSQPQTPATRLAHLDELDEAISRKLELQGVNGIEPSPDDVLKFVHRGMRQEDAEFLVVARYLVRLIGDRLLLANMELLTDAE